MKPLHAAGSFPPFVFVFLLTAAFASADWLELGKDINGDKIYYSLESRTDDTAEVWGKRVFSERGAKEFMIDSKANGLGTEGWDTPGHLVTFYEIKCRENMSRVLSAVIYGADGRIVYAYSFGEPIWEPIPQDSIGSLFKKKVCP